MQEEPPQFEAIQLKLMEEFMKLAGPKGDEFLVRLPEDFRDDKWSEDERKKKWAEEWKKYQSEGKSHVDKFIANLKERGIGLSGDEVVALFRKEMRSQWVKSNDEVSMHESPVADVLPEKRTIIQQRVHKDWRDYKASQMGEDEGGEYFKKGIVWTRIFFPTAAGVIIYLMFPRMIPVAEYTMTNPIQSNPRIARYAEEYPWAVEQATIHHRLKWGFGVGILTGALAFTGFFKLAIATPVIGFAAYWWTFQTLARSFEDNILELKKFPEIRLREQMMADMIVDPEFTAEQVNEFRKQGIEEMKALYEKANNSGPTSRVPYNA